LFHAESAHAFTTIYVTSINTINEIKLPKSAYPRTGPDLNYMGPSLFGKCGNSFQPKAGLY